MMEVQEEEQHREEVEEQHSEEINKEVEDPACICEGLEKLLEVLENLK